MAAVYLFPLKPTVFQLLLNCFLWNQLFSSYFWYSVIIHCDLNQLPAVASLCKTVQLPRAWYVEHFPWNAKHFFPCVTFVLLCKTLVLLCKTFIELSKTFSLLCKSLHCYVRSPKLPLFCLFTELTTQASRKSAMITSPCVVGAILCKISWLMLE